MIIMPGKTFTQESLVIHEPESLRRHQITMNFLKMIFLFGPAEQDEPAKYY